MAKSHRDGWYWLDWLDERMPWPVIILLLIVAMLAGCQRVYHHDLLAIDGDTVWVRGERLRLEGIDAAEMPTSPRNCDRHCPAGDPVEARNVLQAMLDQPGASCVDERGERDYYGRRLVTCYIGEPGPTRVNVNLWMVANGFAETYQPSRPG